MTVTPEPGQTITCTFTNTQQAKILVDKVTDPSGSDESFDFTADYNALGFSLTDAAAVNDSGYLTPDTAYVVTETPIPDGWALTGRTCSADSGSTDWSTTGDNAVTVTPEPGQTITCTFTNSSLHKVVLFVCHTGTNDLVASDWDMGDSLTMGALTSIGATELADLASDLGVSESALEAALCGLQGFDDLDHGDHEFIVNIPGHTEG